MGWEKRTKEHFDYLATLDPIADAEDIQEINEDYLEELQAEWELRVENLNSVEIREMQAELERDDFED